MRHFGDLIVPPTEYSEQAIRRAVYANSKQLLRKGMNRAAFARALVDAKRSDALAPLHLMDHRVRLPRIDGLHAIVTTDENRAATLICERLRTMLLMSRHSGGVELVTEALNLYPEADANVLATLCRTYPRFVDLILRGWLGPAASLLKRMGASKSEKTLATTALRNGLIYHSALQVQLIALRGHCIDRLLLRLVRSPAAYTEASMCKDLIQVVGALEKITEKLVGETYQPPQEALVAERKSAAESHREKAALADDEIVDQITAYLAARRQQIKDLKEKLVRINKRAKVQTVHKGLFDVTSVEALLFAVTRLVQLKLHAADLVATHLLGKRCRLKGGLRALPTITNVEVGKLFYVYRALLLRDAAAQQTTSDNGSVIDLAVEWGAQSHDNFYGENTAKKRQKYMQKASNRRSLAKPASMRLTKFQRIDLLPEFLFHVPPRVGVVLPGAELRARVIKGHEKAQANRPPNIKTMPRRAAKAND